MHLQDKKVSVIGLARSGAAAARFLARRGARVTVCDRKPREQLAAALREFPPDIEVRCGTSRPDPDADWVVLSPGVDAASPDLSDARARGVEILGELELAARFCPAPMIAVTGTNGKTTTATLLGSLLQAAGMDVALAGNIGAPFIECVESPPGDYVVVEVSSFQLETVHLFHPHIALILNLTADHLDRHGTLANYAALKARITRRQEGGDFLILNQDDAEVGAMGTASRAQKSFFSMTGEVPLGAYIKNGILFLRREETATPVLPLDQLSGAAQAQLENVLAAVAGAARAGVDPADMRAPLSRFTGLPHRLEWVRTLNQVDFFNDSKGTNTGAVQKSLRGFDRPLILIMGGRAKGADFSPLAPLLKGRVKHLILMGEARSEIRSILNGSFGYQDADSMEDAVRLAWTQAAPGDVVLLSPGCASFDMFRDFEDRGERFKACVNRL